MSAYTEEAYENAGTPKNKNSYIVANQWTFIENSNKRPDNLSDFETHLDAKENGLTKNTKQYIIL